MAGRYDEPRKLAYEHFEAGGKAKDFASRWGVPRTTVIGWMTNWRMNGQGRTGVGHPFKLEPFKAAEILKRIFDQKALLDREDIRELIQKASTYRMERLGIGRYLKRWNIMPAQSEIERIAKAIDHEFASPARKRKITSVWVDGHQWVVPAVLKRWIQSPPSRILWRIMTRRGMERFTFTNDDSDESVTHLGSLLAEGTRWLVHTDVKLLAETLRKLGALAKHQPEQKRTADG